MTETNGKPNGNGRVKLAARDLVLIVSGICGGLLPSVGGYFVLQYRVSYIESHYVSQDQLKAEVATAVGVSNVSAQKLSDLTDAVQELSQEIKDLRGEWSNYSSHPKGHR